MARSASKTANVHVVDGDMETAAESETPIKMEAPVAAPVAAQQTAPKKKSGIGRRLILSALVLAAIGAGSWYGHEWWINGRFMISTDDAYIQGDITNIAPKLTGYVAKVN